MCVMYAARALERASRDETEGGVGLDVGPHGEHRTT